MVFTVLRLISRVLQRVARQLDTWAFARAPQTLQQEVVIGSTRYNMMTAPDEPYYAEWYWDALAPIVAALPPGAAVSDLGCGQGRLSLRVAAARSDVQVVGCDLSAPAIESARSVARERSITNATFVTRPLAEHLALTPEASQHLVLMTEVTFFYPDWKSDVPGILRSLAPGGVFALAIRPTHFYALMAVQQRNWDALEQVLTQREGRLFSDTILSWDASAEVAAWLAGIGDVLVERRVAIGAASGIAGDPLAGVCRPSSLTPDEQDRLARAEERLGEWWPDAGRYALLIARKGV